MRSRVIASSICIPIYPSEGITCQLDVSMPVLELLIVKFNVTIESHPDALVSV